MVCAKNASAALLLTTILIGNYWAVNEEASPAVDEQPGSIYEYELDLCKIIRENRTSITVTDPIIGWSKTISSRRIPNKAHPTYEVQYQARMWKKFSRSILCVVSADEINARDSGIKVKYSIIKANGERIISTDYSQFDGFKRDLCSMARQNITSARMYVEHWCDKQARFCQKTTETIKPKTRRRYTYAIASESDVQELIRVRRWEKC